MKEPSYRQALQHGWEIMRGHKLLWLFGFFAIFAGQMGLLDLWVSLLTSADHSSALPFLLKTPQIVGVMYSEFASWGLGFSGAMWILWIVLFFVAVKLATIYLSVSSQGALIDGAAQAVKHPKRHTDSDKAWHAGTNHFWRLFALNLSKKIVIFILAALVGFASIQVSKGSGGGDLVILVLALALAICVGMIVSFLAIYAAAYVVVENYNFHDALVSAWSLFKKHVLVSLEVSIILLIINFLVGVLAVGAGLLFVGEMTLILAGSLVVGAPWLWYLALIIGTAVLLVFLAFCGVFLTVLTTSTWTYLFMKMHKKGIKSRILHALTPHEFRNKKKG